MITIGYISEFLGIVSGLLCLRGIRVTTTEHRSPVVIQALWMMKENLEMGN